MIYNADYIIDAVQGTKKTVVSTFVPDSTIRESLTEWIDNQTKLAKTSVKLASEVATRVSEEAMRATEEFTKFDMHKFFRMPGTGKTEHAAQKDAE